MFVIANIAGDFSVRRQKGTRTSVYQYDHFLTAQSLTLYLHLMVQPSPCRRPKNSWKQQVDIIQVESLESIHVSPTGLDSIGVMDGVCVPAKVRRNPTKPRCSQTDPSLDLLIQVVFNTFAIFLDRPHKLNYR